MFDDFALARAIHVLALVHVEAGQAHEQDRDAHLLRKGSFKGFKSCNRVLRINTRKPRAAKLEITAAKREPDRQPVAMSESSVKIS